MDIVTLPLMVANDFVARHHRHHQPVITHRFSIGAVKDGALIGVAIVGNPVARMRADGSTLEVLRLCTIGHKNACSRLYGAAAKAGAALGFAQIGTYTLSSEEGASLRAVGWRRFDNMGGGSWDRESRPRTTNHPIILKTYWLRRFPNAEAVEAGVSLIAETTAKASNQADLLD